MGDALLEKTAEIIQLRFSHAPFLMMMAKRLPKLPKLQNRKKLPNRMRKPRNRKKKPRARPKVRPNHQPQPLNHSTPIPIAVSKMELERKKRSNGKAKTTEKSLLILTTQLLFDLTFSTPPLLTI